jgi:hypothetical protein
MENRRFKDAALLLGGLFILFVCTSWYKNIDYKEEVINTIEEDISYSKIVNPDYDKKYFRKKIYILNKKKTKIPFIVQYDTLKVENLGIYTREIQQ